MAFSPFRTRRAIAVAAVILATSRIAAAQPGFQPTQSIAAPEAGYEFVTDVDVDGEWTAAGAREVTTPRNPGVVYVYRRAGQTWAGVPGLTAMHTTYTCNPTVTCAPDATDFSWEAQGRILPRV